MDRIFFIKNFTRMYFDDMGYCSAIFISTENEMIINILFGMGGATFTIDLFDVLNDEYEITTKELVRYLIVEIEKITKKIQ